MMTISLELPPGVSPPTMKGTLTGPPDDLRIEIRLKDFVSALQQAQAAGGVVQMVPHGVVIDAPKAEPEKVHPLAPSLARVAAKRVTRKTRRVVEAERRSAATEPAAAPATQGEYVPSPGSVPALVLNALRNKGPASSLELTNLLGQDKSPAIYQGTKFLREKGLIDMEISEHDGTRRWRLVQR